MFLLRCHWIFQKFLMTYNPPHFPPISKSKNPQTRETPHNSFFCGTNFLSVLPFLSLHSPPHHLLHFSSFFFLKPEAKLLHKSHSDNVVVIVTSLYLFFFSLWVCLDFFVEKWIYHHGGRILPTASFLLLIVSPTSADFSEIRTLDGGDDGDGGGDADFPVRLLFFFFHI